MYFIHIQYIPQNNFWQHFFTKLIVSPLTNNIGTPPASVMLFHIQQYHRSASLMIDIKLIPPTKKKQPSFKDDRFFFVNIIFGYDEQKFHIRYIPEVP